MITPDLIFHFQMDPYWREVIINRNVYTAFKICDDYYWRTTIIYRRCVYDIA